MHNTTIESDNCQLGCVLFSSRGCSFTFARKLFQEEKPPGKDEKEQPKKEEEKKEEKEEKKEEEKKDEEPKKEETKPGEKSVYLCVIVT